MVTAGDAIDTLNKQSLYALKLVREKRKKKREENVPFNVNSFVEITIKASIKKGEKKNIFFSSLSV